MNTSAFDTVRSGLTAGTSDSRDDVEVRDDELRDSVLANNFREMEEQVQQLNIQQPSPSHSI